MSESIEKVFISAESLLPDSLELGLQIVRSGFNPSFLVGVWRGGAPIGISVQEVLEYNGIECDHIAIRTSCFGCSSAPTRRSQRFRSAGRVRSCSFMQISSSKPCSCSMRGTL